MNAEDECKVRDALFWYMEEARALAKNTRDGTHTQGVLASITVLSLDDGQRAAAALRAMSPSRF